MSQANRLLKELLDNWKPSFDTYFFCLYLYQKQTREALGPHVAIWPFSRLPIAEKHKWEQFVEDMHEHAMCSGQPS